MKDILFHNYIEPKGSFTGKREENLLGPLPGTHGHQPVTLHPVKLPAYQYRLHKYMLSRDSYRLRNEVYQLQRQINDLDINFEVKYIFVKLYRQYDVQTASNSRKFDRRL